MSVDKLLQMKEAFKFNNPNNNDLDEFCEWEEFENSIDAPYWCLMYCAYANVAPDKSLEYIIARSYQFSYLYAAMVLKEKFLIGEVAIASNAQYAFLYAKNVLKNRFPKGEKTITKSAEFSYLYSEFIGKPIGTMSISKSPYYSLQYAKKILKSRFKIGEPTINKHKGIANEYHKFLSLLKKE